MNSLESMKKNKKLVGVIVAIVLLITGLGVGLNVHNKNVQAEAAAEEREAKIKEYDKRVEDVKESIKVAYDTRKDEDISLAKESIKKLNKKDQESYEAEITKLENFLDQISKTQELIAIAEKSNSQKDIDSAQKSIDGLKDDYLAEDKKSLQERLNKLKKLVADKLAAKEKADKEAKEKQEAEAVANAEQTQQAAVAAQAESNANIPADEPATYSGNGAPAENGYNQDYYQAPTIPAQGGYTPQAPAQQAPTPATPSQPAAPQAPSTPEAGSGNGISSQEELDQHTKDASTGGASNWDEVFGKH
jgi:hypothetical protein